MRLRRRLAAGALVVLALTAAAALAWRARVQAASRYTPPVLVDAGAGKRAPPVTFLGVHFGASRLADVKRLAASWRLGCEDRSVRVLMNELRNRKREEIARAAAAGSADAVSGASIVSRRSARDENPQVRLGCEGVRAAQLGDRARPASAGRVLFVFDDAAAAVRHASFQRNHADWGAALADFQGSRAAFAAVLGPEADSVLGMTGGGDGGEAPPKYGRRLAEWRYADLVVSVSVVNLGARGFAVGEAVEVPLPVRADAPSRR